jgi:hypothetical protein
MCDSEEIVRPGKHVSAAYSSMGLGSFAVLRFAKTSVRVIEKLA